MRSDKYERMLRLIAVIWALVYCVLLIMRLHNFSVGAFDLANYAQGIWKLADFKEPVLSAIEMNMLAVHVSSVWFVIAIVFKMIPALETIVVLHVISIISVVLVIYKIAEHYLENSYQALIISLSFLLSQYTQRVLFSPVHPDSFVGLFIALSLFFAVKEKWGLYLLFWILALTGNDDIALYFVPFGIYLMIKPRQKILGMITIAGSLLWIIIAMKLKSFLGSEHDTQQFITRFDYFGDSYSDIAKNIMFKPWLLITSLMNLDKLFAGFQMMLQVGFLTFLTPTGILITAVPILFKSYTNHSGMYRFWDHYSMVVLPFLWVSFIWGVNMIKGNESQSGWLKFAKRNLNNLLLGLLIINALIQSGLPYSPLSLRLEWSKIKGEPSIKQGHQVMKKIPAAASVLTQESLSPQLSLRDKLFIHHYPGQVIHGVPNWRTDYVLYNRNEFKGHWLEKELRDADRFFTISADYTTVVDKVGWVLYKKRRIEQRRPVD